jgi:hypothetical protein
LIARADAIVAGDIEPARPDDLAPPPEPALHPFAIIDHTAGYRGLIIAFRKRVAELGLCITSEELAARSGTPSHYFCKILSPSPTPAKRFGSQSLGAILACLGLKIILVEDPAALERYTKGLPRANASFAHSTAFTQTRSRQFMRKIGRLGAQKRWAAKRQRVRAASRAARIRWQRESTNGADAHE